MKYDLIEATKIVLFFFPLLLLTDIETTSGSFLFFWIIWESSTLLSLLSSLSLPLLILVSLNFDFPPIIVEDIVGIIEILSTLFIPSETEANRSISGDITLLQLLLSEFIERWNGGDIVSFLFKKISPLFTGDFGGSSSELMVNSPDVGCDCVNCDCVNCDNWFSDCNCNCNCEDDVNANESFNRM